MHGPAAAAFAPGRAASRVLLQDRLDYDAALRFNRERLGERTPWLWATTGPMSRGYVGPLFLPDAGPCMACLFTTFHRLSPAPEIYDELIRHSRGGGEVRASPAPEHVVAVVRELVRWKEELAQQRESAAALFRLHVVEAATLEVSSHRVFVDPECAACGGRR